MTLSKDHMAYHTSRYKDFDEFCSIFRSAIDSLHRITSPALVERLALRYVDVIVDTPEGPLSRFLNPGILGPPQDRLHVSQSSCFMNYVGRTDSGNLSIRALQRSDGGFMPPDLTPAPLAVVAKEVLPNSKVMVLDLDHTAELEAEPEDFSAEGIAHRLWQLHDKLTIAFLESTTPDAWKAWGRRERR